MKTVHTHRIRDSGDWNKVFSVMIFFFSCYGFIHRPGRTSIALSSRSQQGAFPYLQTYNSYDSPC